MTSSCRWMVNFSDNKSKFPDGAVASLAEARRAAGCLLFKGSRPLPCRKLSLQILPSPSGDIRASINCPGIWGNSQHPAGKWTLFSFIDICHTHTKNREQSGKTTLWLSHQQGQLSLFVLKRYLKSSSELPCLIVYLGRESYLWVLRTMECFSVSWYFLHSANFSAGILTKKKKK